MHLPSSLIAHLASAKTKYLCHTEEVYGRFCSEMWTTTQRLASQQRANSVVHTVIGDYWQWASSDVDIDEWPKLSSLLYYYFKLQLWSVSDLTGELRSMLVGIYWGFGIWGGGRGAGSLSCYVIHSFYGKLCTLYVMLKFAGKKAVSFGERCSNASWDVCTSNYNLNGKCMLLFCMQLEAKQRSMAVKHQIMEEVCMYVY